MIATHTCRRHAGFLLSQNPDDLFFTEPTLTRRLSPIVRQTLAYFGGVFRGKVTMIASCF